MTTNSRTIPEVRLEDLAATGIGPLEESGCLVINGVTGAAERERLRRELAPGMDGVRVWEGDDPKAFFPGYTRRLASMVARSETARDWEWIGHTMSGALGFSEEYTGDVSAAAEAAIVEMNREHAG